MSNTAQQGRPAVAAGRPLPDVIGRRHTFAWEQVLACLAQRDRDGSGAVVGKREVAEGLHMSPNTADRAMVLLRRRGLVEAAAHHADNGGQLANSYRLTHAGAECVARLALQAYGQTR